MSMENKEIFEFGEFRLDVDEHTIERIDGPRNGALTGKAFQALVLLVRRRGHLVSKKELIQFVWPDTIVEDNNLEKCVHLIRHVLGEKPGEHKYIETVRKHGYRFVATVNKVEKPDDGAASLFDIALLNERKELNTHSQPIISTATTESGAFVVSAKWSSEKSGKIVQENGSSHQKSSLTDPQPALEPKRASWTIKRSIVAAVLFFAATAALLYFLIFR